ncbi:MAG: type II secretion system secretin GspD [Bryobacteraceae bacterium]
MTHSVRTVVVYLTMFGLLAAQQPPPAPSPEQAKSGAAAAAPAAQQVKPEQPAAPAPAPDAAKPEAPPAATTPQAAAPTAQVTPGPGGGAVLHLQNASLIEVIDVLARQLRINYILDPRVKGSVTVHTYGELREVNARALLDTILRINGFAMVEVGPIHRIVPLAEVARMPLSPRVNPQNLPDDEQMSLNLIFLKYATVGELSKLLERFIGEGASMIVYEPANLLLLLDNNRNMRRTMELIALFDSDALAGQRVRLFEVKNGSPSDIAKELDSILRSISLGGEKASPVKLMPLDRINTIIAVAPNPGVFETVETWLKKLDVRVEITVGAMDNYVYRVKYGQAEILAAVIMQLYLGMLGYPTYGMGMMGGIGYGGYGGYTGAGYGGYPGMAAMGGYGGYPGMAYGGYGMAGGYFPGAYGLQAGRMGAMAARNPTAAAAQAGGGAATAQQTPAVSPMTGDLSGYYLGAGLGLGKVPEGMPRVVPNPMDNTLLIQATAQDYAKILKLLKELDIPPRQVLIEAKIYEVTLTGAFASGVTAYFQKLNGGMQGAPTSRVTEGTSSAAGLGLTSGVLVGKTRELLGILSASEDNRNTKVISAPMVIATDSIPASINVGQEVPVLASQAVTGVQQGGSSLFANTISSRSTGVTLNVLARVNPSGIVTLVINQEVSSPQAPSANAAIQSPSFSTRTVQTQVTVQDGDTIAVGGIISESNTSSSAGVPFLHRIPVVGSAFGAKSKSNARTELVVFMTPRVIYDTNAIVDASEEVKSQLKRITKILQE